VLPSPQCQRPLPHMQPGQLDIIFAHSHSAALSSLDFCLRNLFSDS